MKGRKIPLLFLTLVLLVVPSISLIVTADVPVPPPPKNIKKGDIVLIRWAHVPLGLYSGLTYHHSLLYIGKDKNGVPRVIDADVTDDYPNGKVLNETWHDAMYRQLHKHGIERFVVVRLNDAEPDPEKKNFVKYAVKFADDRARLSNPPCHYDFWSQSPIHLRKQVKEQPDSWWADVLPPKGYIGPSHSDSWWMSRFSGDHGRDYYCNELIWASYFETDGSEDYHHYIEKNPDPLAIRGWELEHDDNTHLKDGTASGAPRYYDDK